MTSKRVWTVVVRSLATVGLLSTMATGGRAVAGLVTQASVLAGAPDAQGSSASIVSYPSISNLVANTSGTTTNRGIGQNASCDISILPNGTVYYLVGSGTTTGDKTLFSWPSLAAWASNTSVTNIGTRTNYGPVSGMSIYGGEFYVLEGNPTNGGTKSLVKWSNSSSWASGAVGTTVGSRLTGDGIGFEIAPDATVYFLSNNPYTGTSGTLYQWPSISDFLGNANQTDTGAFTYFSGSPNNQISGLAIVPEPSTWVMGLAGVAWMGWGAMRQRKRA